MNSQLTTKVLNAGLAVCFSNLTKMTESPESSTRTECSPRGGSSSGPSGWPSPWPRPSTATPWAARGGARHTTSCGTSNICQGRYIRTFEFKCIPTFDIHTILFTLLYKLFVNRFKWIHLSERLAYEAAVKQQRMRTEISQVKREAEHFKSSVERKRKKSKVKSATDDEKKEEVVFQFKQRETEAQIKKRKRDQNVFVVQDIDQSEAKSKKAKKGGMDSANANITVKVKSKSKRGKKEKPLGVRKEGDRTQFLKSVFGGGGV